METSLMDRLSVLNIELCKRRYLCSPSLFLSLRSFLSNDSSMYVSYAATVLLTNLSLSCFDRCSYISEHSPLERERKMRIECARKAWGRMIFKCELVTLSVRHN